jgi:hypothetical protein
MQPSPDIQFSITPDEANVILNALAHRPYIEVINLINKLQAQAQACLAQGANNAELQGN